MFYCKCVSNVVNITSYATRYARGSLVERLRATDDELGMVLGHEISHLLHGHTEQRHEKAMWYSMYQLIFLTALDSWGILTFISLPFADRMQKMWLAAHSRENECEVRRCKS